MKRIIARPGGLVQKRLVAVHFAKEIGQTSNIDVRGRKIHKVLRCAARTVYRDCDLPQPLQLPFVIVSVKVQIF